MSVIKPLADALPFIRFTDANVGAKFVKSLRLLDNDLGEVGYTFPEDEDHPVEDALEELTIAITDAGEELALEEIDAEEANELLTHEEALAAEESALDDDALLELDAPAVAEEEGDSLDEENGATIK